MNNTPSIRLKKAFGQHFLHDHAVVERIINAVAIGMHSSIFEIGPGAGFLTKAILDAKPARLWAFEIDEEWVVYLRKQFSDERLTIFHEDFLQTDLRLLEPYQPWILLANLPYNITFPILQRLCAHRSLLQEGVIMVQEEVAQKITKRRGRDYGAISLFAQYHFTWQLLDKIPPTAFRPPPKVFSRLLHFVPRTHSQLIPQAERFWEFVKVCFAQPRRMLANNIRRSNEYRSVAVPARFTNLRAQQLSLEDFLGWWNELIS